jgi:hypothetical protein
VDQTKFSVGTIAARKTVLAEEGAIGAPKLAALSVFIGFSADIPQPHERADGSAGVGWAKKKCRGPGMDRTSADSFRVVGRGMSPKVATSVVTVSGF